METLEPYIVPTTYKGYPAHLVILPNGDRFVRDTRAEAEELARREGATQIRSFPIR